MTVRFAPNCALLVGNAGGAVQQLPDVRVGGKIRAFIERITLASQVIGDSIMIARIPYGADLLEVLLSTDTSLGSSTLSLGDANSSARYSALTAYTTLNSDSNILNVAGKGIPITTAYDNTGVASLAYTDLLLTIAAANLPASGNLVMITEYVDYGS